jgi:Polyketide cyclase / dehydrase and lipid transport
MPALLEPVDETFFASAPERYSDTFAIPRPAGEVWAELVSDKPLAWCRGLSLNWTSARPFGVGTTRLASSLGGAVKLKERYFIWTDGHRQAFYVTEANLPLFKRFAEDYVVEPEGTDRCRFTWTFAIEPTALGRPGAPLNGFIFRRMFAETRRHYGAS